MTTPPFHPTSQLNQETKIHQPNSRHCFVCGVNNPFGLHLNFYETASGEVTAQVALPDEFQGYPGVVHGGVVAAMLDEAAGRALMGNDIRNPRFMFTAKMEITYRRNVPIGQPILLEGKALEIRGRKATASSAIYDLNGTLLAEAHALLIKVPDQVVDNVDMEALGWKVYPEEGSEL
jgi:acyl-coenzyme A thioesterase PaaI-like protein